MEPSQTHPFPKSDDRGNLIRDDVAQAAERAKATAAEAVDRTADAAATALDQAAAKRDQWRASQQRLMADAADCMRAHPLASIGFAFGAGFLISRLLGSRSD